MKKLLILPIIMAMCAVETSAFAASARGTRGGGTSASSAGGAPKVNGARAAKIGGGKVSAPGKSTGTAGTKTSTAKPSAGKPNGARAAATKKAINMGTKVSTAVENTTVSPECQNAYYGCMDAFCMMDNGSGGRCQCNDRITELDKILDEIMKLDEKSMNLATQGVEKVQMGELASQIDARAKSLEKEFLSDEEKAKQAAAQPKKRELDLSAWNNSSLFDDDDDVFEDEKKEDFEVAADLANKKGDELHRGAAKICAQQIPAECKASAVMLQQTYAQKIRSDCTGYENALKQQRTASAQKLQTAQRAVREALLDEEKNKNKYEDLGTCVIAFKQCMQTTGECGEDFSGCVADTAILSELYGKTKSKNKIATTQIKTGATTVTISSATYDVLQNKALRCESVVRQCQNANKGKNVVGGAVLGEFLKDVALTVYNTEYRMASDSRMNCMTTIINCVKKSCKSAGMDEGTDNYDACLSNPNSIKNYCSLEIKRCGDVGSENDVISYVQAKLAADKVDRCTQQVKDCLASENACGEDYSGCIGLNMSSIMRLCPLEKLVACQDKFDMSDSGQQKMSEYIDRIVMGLKLRIETELVDSCQKTLDEAITKMCGDERCESLEIGSVAVNVLDAQICKDGTDKCYNTASNFAVEDIVKGVVVPRLVNRIDINRIDFDSDTKQFVYRNGTLPAYLGYSDQGAAGVTEQMNSLLKNKMAELEAMPALNRCINGRDASEFMSKKDKDGNVVDGTTTKTLPGLTNSIKLTVANRIKDAFVEKYMATESSVEDEKFPELYTSISDTLTRIATAEQLAIANEEMCKQRAEDINRRENMGVSTGSWTNDTNAVVNTAAGVRATAQAQANAPCTANGGYCELGSQYFFDTWWGRNERRQALYWTTASYDQATGACTLKTKKYPCKDYRTGPEICANWDTTGVDDHTQTVQLAIRSAAQ